MNQTIRVDVDPRGVATLTLIRTDKHNAMSEQMIAEITHETRRLGRDPAVRVVVLAAEGKTFCAGGDLGWMREQMDADATIRAGAATKLAQMFQTLNTCPKPVIGKVQGNAFGGGAGLIACCDVVVSADTAKFGFTETRLGLIPATIGPYVAARMGEACARRVFMSARVFDAVEAETLGLIARAVAADDLDTAVEAEVLPYLSVAPGAVADAKALLRQLGPVIDDATIARTIEALVRRWESDEAVEGIAAFFDRRAPGWA